MIELTKDVIETGGFEQLITGFTRQAPHQDDSLIDQIWTNCAQKTLRHFNEVREPSDHNVNRYRHLHQRSKYRRTEYSQEIVEIFQ